MRQGGGSGRPGPRRRRLCGSGPSNSARRVGRSGGLPAGLAGPSRERPRLAPAGVASVDPAGRGAVPAVQGPAGPARPRGRTSGFLAPTGGHQGSGRGTETHRQAPDRSVAPCSTRSPRCSTSSSQSMGSCRAPHRSSRRASSCAGEPPAMSRWPSWASTSPATGSGSCMASPSAACRSSSSTPSGSSAGPRRWRSLCDSRGPAPRTPDSALGLATAGLAPLPAQRLTEPCERPRSTSGRACPPTSAPPDRLVVSPHRAQVIGRGA